MKMKRWISILLTLALCLGLLPGAALAETDTSSTLPEGYQQMYFESDSSYTTNIEFALNYSTALNGKLFSAQNSDSSIAITSSALSFSTTGLGALVTPPDGNIVWDTYSNAVAGTSGFLLFESETEKYAIAVSIYAPSEDNPTDTTLIYDDNGNSEFTMDAGMEQAFTFPPTIYVDGVSTRLVAKDYSGETYTFATTVGSLYWHEGFNELAINTVGITSDTTGKITITNKVSGEVYTCEIKVNAAFGGDNESDSSTEGDAPAEVGLKLCTDAAGTTEVSKVDGVYNVGIAEGVTTTVYLHITGGDNATFADDTSFSVTVGPNVEIVSSELLENNTVLAITHHGDRDWATMENTRGITVGEKEFSFVIKFVNSDSGTEGDDSGNGDSTEGEGSTSTVLESGVYTALTDDGQLDGYTEMISINGEVYGYNVSYDSNKSVTVYYYHPTKTCSTTSNYVNITDVSGLTGVQAITLKENLVGTFEVGISLTNSDGSSGGGFPIVFSDGYSQMYYQFTAGNYATDIELSLGGSTALNGNLFADANGATAIDLSGHTLSFDKDGLGSIINAPDGNTVWVTNDITAEASGYLYAVNNSDSSVKYAIAVSVKEQSGPPSSDNQGGSGENQGNSRIEYTLVTESRDITDNDKITREVAEKIQVGPASFQYDTDNDQTPETYYICAMGGAAEGEYHMSISGGSGSPDGQFWSDFSLGIWTYNPKGDTYSLVSDEIQEILLKSFGDSWSFELYNTTSSENTAYSSTYPAVYSWTDPNGWPLGVAFQYVEPGDWYYGFSGTINNTTVTSYTRSSFKLVNEVEYDAESIADVNDFLQQWEATEKAEGYPRKRVYIINLPEGRFEGNIVVPEGFYWVNVVGAGEDKTTLVGSINTGSTLRVQSLTMEGCGWNNAVQSDGVTPNYGIYGTGNGRYRYCTFRNYYHALHATGGLFFGGEFGTFENNLIALYLNSPRNGGGATSMEDCIYRHNGCALWLEDFGNDFPMNSYHVSRCKFYDNGWDVINLLGKCFFLPGQLFERDGQYGHGKFAGRRDALITPPKETAPQRASHAAANVSEEGSGVYTFPVAKNDKFIDFDYTNKDAVIGNHNASDWLIPEKDLDGKTITVIQDEKGEDKIVWSFGE